MRKLTVLLLTGLLAASFATTADAAKRKKVMKDPGLVAQEQSNKFVGEMFMPWSTTWAEPAKTKRVHKHKAKKKKKA